MIYSEVCGEKLPLLGLGTMRLPMSNGEIDENAVVEMVECAMNNGVNYFDTAYPYHSGRSEIVIGKALSKYPRDSFFLADKYPGHQILEDYTPSVIFEEQLKKCGVEYFDFYLLHNVYESSISTYTDKKWGIIDYFLEQKRLGRIKHLGFSTHGSPEFIRDFLDEYGKYMEFCQIQLNYLDSSMQNAMEKYDIITSHNIPVWVMEPVRGGKLAVLPSSLNSRLTSARPDMTAPEWAFKWLMRLPNVKMVLSGMSNMQQMQENIKTFDTLAPLSDSENQLILEIAERLKCGVPCTSCRYCCDGCPQGLDIPTLLSLYNDAKFMPTMVVSMSVEGLADDNRPEACIGCGACTAVCPQKIDIPAAMSDFSEIIKTTLPSWKKICEERNLAAKANKK